MKVLSRVTMLAFGLVVGYAVYLRCIAESPSAKTPEASTGVLAVLTTEKERIEELAAAVSDSEEVDKLLQAGELRDAGAYQEVEAGVESKPAPSNDSEWGQFPVVQWSFARRVMRLPAGLEAGDLFKHVELNPSTSYVPPAKRFELQQIIAIQGALARAAQDSPRRVRHSEINALIRNGEAEQHEAAPAVGKERTLLSHKQAGKILSLRDGKMYTVDPGRLAATKEMGDWLEFFGRELGTAIVQWFYANGYLRAHQRDELLASLYLQGEQR